MATWTNHVAIATPRNATSTHTVSPASGTVVSGTLFTPTAGRLLVCVVEGAVTSTTPTGWTLPTGGSAVNNTGLYVWYRTAAGSDTWTTTHNASNYPVLFDIYEFAASSTFVKSIGSTGVVPGGGAGPSLTALTGTNHISFVGAQGEPSTTGATTYTWSTGTEALETYVNASGTDGYTYSLAYLLDSVLTSASSAATATGAGATLERLVFAVNIAAGVTAYSGPATVVETITITATGSVAVTGAGSLPVGVTVNASGTVATATGASVVLGAALTAVGTVSRASSATLAETVTLTATSQLGITGAGSGTVTVGVSGSGVVAGARSATTAEIVTVSASGVVTGSASVAETVTLTGTGAVVSGQTALVAATATGSAIGIVAGTGAGTVAVSVTPVSTGLVARASGSSLPATASGTATGTVGAGVGASVVLGASTSSLGVLGSSSTATSSATVSVSATGSLVTSQPASVTETVSITAAGAVTTGLGANVAETVTLTVTGLVARASSATLAETVTVSSSGSVGSAAPVAATLSVTASGILGKSSTAPRAETVTIMATGEVVTGTNLSVNPSFEIDLNHWASQWFGPAHAGTSLRSATGLFGTYAYRKTWTTVNGSAVADVGIAYSRFPAVAGQTYSASMWMRSSMTEATEMRFRFYDSNNVIIAPLAPVAPNTNNGATDTYGAPVIVQPNVWKLFKAENVTAPPGTYGIVLVPGPYHGSVAAPAVGDWIEFDGLMVNVGPTVLDYQDLNTVTSTATAPTVVAVTTTGALAYSASASLDTTVSATATGALSLAASATATASVSIDATGAVTTGLGAPRPVTVAVSATGLVAGSRTATSSVTTTITASGVVGLSAGGAAWVEDFETTPRIFPPDGSWFQSGTVARTGSLGYGHLGVSNLRVATALGIVSRGPSFRLSGWARLDLNTGIANLAGLAFAANAADVLGYAVVLDGRNGTGTTASMQLRKDNVVVATATPTILSHTWYQLVVTWDATGLVTFQVFDTARTLVGTVTSTETLYTAGRVGIYGFDAASFDDLALTGNAVQTAALTADGAVGAAESATVSETVTVTATGAVTTTATSVTTVTTTTTGRKGLATTASTTLTLTISAAGTVTRRASATVAVSIARPTTASASSGIACSVGLAVTATGALFAPPSPTSETHVLVVGAELRVYAVPSESRAVAIPGEQRVAAITPEDRTDRAPVPARLLEVTQ